MEQIKKVYVVHKTHLDIGFTDFSQNVLKHYMDCFIPKAIKTAYEVNIPHMPKQFVWTVGSYLIKYYMEHADADAKLALEKAIEDGYVEWHLLPCTTHTELMDADLFCYGIQMGKELDKIYGKNHIAAKLTDVPGITHAAIPYLEKMGVKYLHIGINASSRAVNVPDLCLFKYGDSEVVLNYAKNYGESFVFKDIALEFAHTADNIGPPDALCIKKEMERLRTKYPDAQIVSASLDEFAGQILPYKDELPVISCEMGDTWIHGIASDPFKTAMFRELTKIRRQWTAEDPSAVFTKEYDIFMENMLLICEHTWGLDSKKYLSDYLNWDKNDFIKAKSIYEGAYSMMENSWEEQRNYLNTAEKQLPEHLYQISANRRKKLKPYDTDIKTGKMLGKTIELSGWKVSVEVDGKLCVHEKNGRIFQKTKLGILEYETYDSNTVYDCYYKYNRNFETEGEWAEPDFAKPGLCRAKTARNNTFNFRVEQIEIQEESITVSLSGRRKAYEIFGCPQNAVIVYSLQKDHINITVEWFHKPCNKMPEAIYFGFQFDEYDDMSLTKLGLPVDPSQVIEGGNTKLHAIEEVYAKTWKIIPYHSPLVSLGGRSLYDCEDINTDWKNGIHFILQNNRWNTNFPLWYGENASFDFTIWV